MIHLTSRDVPPFPPQDPVLLDPFQWPDSVTFLDRWFYLNLMSSLADVVYTGDKQQVIRSGRRVHVGYGSPWKTSKIGIPIYLSGGPSYSWNEYGRLYRRVWCEPDTVTFHEVLYETYSSGALVTYMVAEREADIQVASTHLRFKENFGKSGELLALSYTKTGQPNQCWWKGRRIAKTKWEEKDRQLRIKADEEERKEHRKRN